jgi:hypothetical protein
MRRMQKMNRLKMIGIFVVGIVMMVSLIPCIAATPPRYLKIEYQEGTHILKVTLTHFSPARSIHYIYRIIVQRNGALEQSHFYTKQPHFFINTYEFNLSANPGDVITVSAYCILFGYNTRSTTVSPVVQSLQI